MPRVETLEDLANRQAITDVIHRYASRIDAGDIDGVLACFSEECQAEYGNGAVVLNCKAALKSFLERALDTGESNSRASSHFMTNVLITPLGAKASVETTAMAVRNLSPGQVTVRGLIYRDRFVREGRIWRIRKREHFTVWEFETPGRFLAGSSPSVPRARS